MPNLLILLTLPAAVGDRYRDALQRRFPELNIDVVDHHTKAAPFIASADILLTFAPMLSDAMIAAAQRLRWIQALGTGVDNLIDLPSLRRDVIVTNMRGIHGPMVSEAAIAAMLALSRDLPRSVRCQDRRQWVRWPARLLHGKTVGILGIGVIAEALAPRCKAFGMRVIGITSTKREVRGFDDIQPREALVEAVRELDYLVLLTPLTAATRGIIDARVLGAMKRESYLINLARGGVVDEEALIAVLREGKIAGAALDVFLHEPLPPQHPFWSMENVLVTAHQGGFCDVYPDYALPIVEHNMRCFLSGDIKGMINVVEH
jgi:phosphoglycerate dehydrogenase-like enzyme